jgi:hypothetical protein
VLLCYCAVLLCRCCAVRLIGAARERCLPLKQHNVKSSRDLSENIQNPEFITLACVQSTADRLEFGPTLLKVPKFSQEAGNRILMKLPYVRYIRRKKAATYAGRQVKDSGIDIDNE